MQLRRQRASLTARLWRWWLGRLLPARLRRWWPGRRSVASILRQATPYHRRGLAFEHRDGSLVTVDHLVLTYDAIVAVHERAVCGRVSGRSADTLWQVQREPAEVALGNPLIAAQRQAQAVSAALGPAPLPVIPVVVFAHAALDLAICRPHCVCDRAGLAGLARRWSQPDGEAHAALWRSLIARARPRKPGDGAPGDGAVQAAGVVVVSCLAGVLTGVLAGAPALVNPSPAMAQEAGQDNVPGRHWLERGAEGWFWYHDPTPAPRDVPPAPPVPPSRPPAAAPAAPPPPPGVTAAEAAAPAPLSAAWFRANLDHYREQAIDRPTPDNVASYLYLQRIMMDKADTFAAAAQAVVASDPALDANNERPLGTAAANAVTALAARAQDNLLGQVAAFAGLLLFLRSDCPICTQQAATLDMLRRQFGFQVMVVSLDGLPPPGAVLPGLRRDAGQAARLGVRQVPALFMLRPPAAVMPVSYGVLTLDDLKTRVLLLARQAQWVSEAAWQATQPVTHRSLAPLAALITPDLLADPAALVARIRAALQVEPGS